MSNRLDPQALFDLIAVQVPAALHLNLLIVGSLAAAYRFRDQLPDFAVTTKDADVVIQPAGALEECRQITQELLGAGWRRTESCYPSPQPAPAEELRAIRLYPPQGRSYFIELLAFPSRDQTENLSWIPCDLPDGWYGLPSFRFLGLTQHFAERAANGLAYAGPSMMAMSNLLSHPKVGTVRMSEPIGGRRLLRAAKDLGRVLALARLSSPEEVAGWTDQWEQALRERFPQDCGALAGRAGAGLRELLADEDALDDAKHALDVGILAGFEVEAGNLRALGQQLLIDVLDPLARRFVG